MRKTEVAHQNRLPWTPDCAADDCKRAAYKGGLCRRHWYEIPFADRAQLAIGAMMAAHDFARERHREFRARFVSDPEKT